MKIGVFAIIPLAFSSLHSDTPKRKKGERLERVARFTLNAPAEKIFPLLCPVEEYKWLPGWSCKMFYSESGVAAAGVE